MKKLIEFNVRFWSFFLPKKNIIFHLKLFLLKCLLGINIKLGVSAQLKSAVILAGLNSFGNTKIIEKKTRSRDHTENMLLKNKKVIKIKKNKKKIIKILEKKYLKN